MHKYKGTQICKRILLKLNQRPNPHINIGKLQHPTLTSGHVFQTKIETEIIFQLDKILYPVPYYLEVIRESIPFWVVLPILNVRGGASSYLNFICHASF